MLYKMHSDRRSISVVQQQDHQPNPDLPRYMQKPNTQIEEIEMSAPEAMNAWVWPVACWIIIGLNTVAAFIAIFGMRDNYNPWTHFFTMGTFVCTLGCLALIHKIILRGK